MLRISIDICHSIFQLSGFGQVVQIWGVESYEGIMSSYVDTENLSYYDLDLWLNKALSGNNKNVKTEIPKGGAL